MRRLRWPYRRGGRIYSYSPRPDADPSVTFWFVYPVCLHKEEKWPTVEVTTIGSPRKEILCLLCSGYRFEEHGR